MEGQAQGFPASQSALEITLQLEIRISTRKERHTMTKAGAPSCQRRSGCQRLRRQDVDSTEKSLVELKPSIKFSIGMGNMPLL